MADRVLERNIDPSLSTLLEEDSDQLTQSQKADFHAGVVDPVIKNVLARKLGLYSKDMARPDNDFTEDIYQQICLKVWKRLDHLRNNPEQINISDFRAYVAAIASNVCNEFLRGSKPEWNKLKKSLYNLLVRHRDFDIWEDYQGQRLCGFTAWRARKPSFSLQRRGNHSVAKLSLLLQERFRGCDLQHMERADLIAELFNLAGSPIPLKLLTDSIATLLGIQERQVDQLDENLAAGLADRDLEVARNIENKQILLNAWDAIRKLPSRQHRAALLLSLRDAGRTDLLNIFIQSSIASFDQIADALELPPHEMEQIWNDLPLDDTAIAKLLGVKYEQVRKLRSSARKRLRHLKSI